MKNLKKDVCRWLTEIEKTDVVRFLEDCSIEYRYLGTGSNTKLSKVIYFYDAIIKIPSNYYKQIDLYDETKEIIKKTMKEFAILKDVAIETFYWRPLLDNSKDEIESEREFEIKKHTNSKYIYAQIDFMHQSLRNKNSSKAIGTAKELIETCCKSLLLEKGIEIKKDWDLVKLFRETRRFLNFLPFDGNDSVKANEALTKIFSGFNSIIQGIAELRNPFGTGHGHEADFEEIDKKYARIVVAASVELALFLLSKKKV